MFKYTYQQNGFIEILDNTETAVVAYLAYDDIFNVWTLHDLELPLTTVELQVIINKLDELNETDISKVE